MVDTVEAVNTELCLVIFKYTYKGVEHTTNVRAVHDSYTVGDFKEINVVSTKRNWKEWGYVQPHARVCCIVLSIILLVVFGWSVQYKLNGGMFAYEVGDYTDSGL